ncbi:hypothetical protein GLAREA_07339 [Glarea lozoyensis ATCC 20868]|uniref:Heterokaryon incompatibility domain-containing protein n=1 Tax=Glarea lozoyensis (strain ATCC 20868 / MF5171) TaxID=1116229 RepID=S3DJJ2_GLAL2|nr:uncharacterized protein GLAREA_07339 [Glarea lozoyensis ATCC 20868]EPE32206.1 hypothetical protein GLAREA_07339 [Glarea lozoyensis ATCC 20868]
MSDTDGIMECALGAARFWIAARERVDAIDAVPQAKALTVGLKNGWDCHLEPYTYQPLLEPDGIRVLRIFPWKERLQTIDGLYMPRCELIHLNLNSSPEYATISYAWGSLLENSPVLLHGQNFLTVTNSLFEVICWTSIDTEEPLYFWADQICINQHDLVERSKQVNMMGRIYKQATLTFVWLGKSGDTDEVAFDLIKKLSLDDLPLVKAYDTFLFKNVVRLQSILEPYGIGCNGSEPGWIAIKDLSLRPWFTRLWTFKSFGIYNTHLLHRQRNRYLTTSSTKLLDLLWEISDSDYQCKDQRDRVFSVLSLAGSDKSSTINVDYSLSVAKVYLSVAREIIKSTASLKILTRRRCGELEDLPSWAPNWSFGISSQMALDTGNLSFSSSGGFQHIYKESEEHILIFKGKIISTIAKVASHNFTEHGDEYDSKDLEHFLGFKTLVPQILEELEGWPHVDGSFKRRTWGYWNWLLGMNFSAGNFGNRTDAYENGLDVADFMTNPRNRYERDLRKCFGRKIAILDTYGYPLGLVPDYARAGDNVCILNGSTTPLVLRKNGQSFEVIGECYVNGIMYGEAVDWSQEGGETFVIK